MFYFLVGCKEHAQAGLLAKPYLKGRTPNAKDRFFSTLLACAWYGLVFLGVAFFFFFMFSAGIKKQTKHGWQNMVADLKAWFGLPSMVCQTLAKNKQWPSGVWFG